MFCEHARRDCWRHLLASLLLVVATAAAPLHAAQDMRWITTWTASPQPLWNGDFALPTNVPYHVWNQTVRQGARVSLGGQRVRVLLSNEYGTQPLRIGAAHIARSGRGAGIDAASRPQAHLRRPVRR